MIDFFYLGLTNMMVVIVTHNNDYHIVAEDADMDNSELENGMTPAF